MKTNNVYAILLNIILGVSCNFVKPESNTAEIALIDSLQPDFCIGGSIQGNGIQYSGDFDAVFIFAGQSNMVGRGTDNEPPENIPEAYIWTGKKWEGYVSQTHVGQIGPEYSFVTEWVTDHPGQTVGIIKYACGGSNMSQWIPSNSFANDLYHNYIAAGSHDINGFLWMQGEAESTDCAIANQYKMRTQELIYWQYAHFKTDKFVMGQTQQVGLCSYIVRSAQASLSKATLVNIDDLPTGEDGVHLNKSSQIEFGKRLYSAFINE